MTNPSSRDIIIQQKLYHVNMANSTVRVIVRVKGTLIKVIIDTGANVSIIILPVVKKLWMVMGMPDKSKIIAIDQIKKNVIDIVRDASFSIQDAKILISLLIIDIPKDNLLLGTDWMNWYQADLFFQKREMRFWCKK